jgi:hypothetical protein
MLPAGDDDSNADSDLVASLLLKHRRKQQHKSDVRVLLLDAPCTSPPPPSQQLSARDFEQQVSATEAFKPCSSAFYSYLLPRVSALSSRLLSQTDNPPPPPPLSPTLQLTDIRSCTRSLTTCLRADAADMQQLMLGMHEAALQSEHGNAARPPHHHLHHHLLLLATTTRLTLTSTALPQDRGQPVRGGGAAGAGGSTAVRTCTLASCARGISVAM